MKNKLGANNVLLAFIPTYLLFIASVFKHVNTVNRKHGNTQAINYCGQVIKKTY